MNNFLEHAQSHEDWNDHFNKAFIYSKRESMKKLKLKFYINIAGTNIRCDKIESVFEVISVNFNDLMKSANAKLLPLKIMVEQSVLDKINHEVAIASCSRYNMKTVKIYANQTAIKNSHVIEIMLKTDEQS
jgi:hypothetical protein